MFSYIVLIVRELNAAFTFKTEPCWKVNTLRTNKIPSILNSVTLDMCCSCLNSTTNSWHYFRKAIELYVSAFRLCVHVCAYVCACVCVCVCVVFSTHL